MIEVFRIVGGIAGIGGLGFGIIMLIYRDFVRNFILHHAFRTLSPPQATMLFGAVIFFTFATATLGMFAGLAASDRALPFIGLVGLLLVFVLAVLSIATRRHAGSWMYGDRHVPLQENVYAKVRRLIVEGRLQEADRELNGVAAARRATADFWYWRARVALAYENVDVASRHINKARNLDPRDEQCIALQIKLLLLGAGDENRRQARELADRSRRLNSTVSAWLDCLNTNRMFEPGVRSNTELDMICQFPEPEFERS